MALALSVLAGCQNGEAPVAQATPAVTVKKTSPVGDPGTTEPTKIALVVHKGPPITVGYPSPEKLFDEFRDNKHAGSEYNDLPANFDSHYKARTYETAHTGFGEILFDGDETNAARLVAAMYQEDHADQDRVDELRTAHSDQIGLLPTPITGKKVSYWFWELDGQRLMICSFQTGHDFKITVCMGDDKVMDGLGISIEQATKDRAIIDNAATTQQTPKPL